MKAGLRFDFVFVLLVFFFSSLGLNAQPDTTINSLIQAFKLANKKYPDESVYLHTDRNSYWASDDLWFKSYLVTTSDTANLYVELISPWGEVLQKKIYLAADGLAYGDIHLPDTTSTGVYQLRAYTSWMRNFGDASFFKKDIVVWNIRDKEIQSVPYSDKKEKISLKFFPEGGTFIAGVSNKLGFKAIDENGVGVAVNGIVVDEDNTLVATFNSLFKGMGSFTMVPVVGREYKAIVNINEKEEVFDLPEFSTNGVAIGVESTNGENLTISINDRINDERTSAHSFFLVGQTRGNILFSSEVKTVDGQYGLRINKKSLPSGVLQLTLFDEALRPRCERLVFINHSDYLPVTIEPDKDEYKLRELVELDIESLLQDSIPMLSNLSLSVFTAESELGSDEYPSTILTHFLLESDLKGRIESPGYYFSKDDRRTRMALDNLMLTQGWRRFTWQNVINDSWEIPGIERQEAIELKGKVTTRFLERPLSGVTVSIFLEDKDYAHFEQQTDSLGRFNFNDLYFTDLTSVLIRIPEKVGARNTWLEVDDEYANSPEVAALPVNYRFKNDQKVTTTYDISIKDSSLIQRKWHISDTILLNDINIIGRKAIEPFNDASLIFPDPDKTVKINEDEDIWPDIYVFIENKLPGVYIDYSSDFGSAPSIRIGANTGSALLLLDGIPVDSELIYTLPFTYFKQIDVQRIAYMFGLQGQNGAINFTSRGIMLNQEVRLPDGFFKTTLQGYAEYREFYSPDYEDQKHDIEKRDFRSTLYWNPLVWTNNEGVSKQYFYNSDQAGKVNIVVEGFTFDGRLCRGTASYNVKF